MHPRGHYEPANSLTSPALITLDHIIDAISGHRREILTMLAVNGPVNVGDLAAKMVLGEATLSHELHKLADFGLVRWTRDKKFHHYELSRLVPAFKCDGMVQMMIAAQTTDWLWWHCDAVGTAKRRILPPDCFVDFQNDLRRPYPGSKPGRTEDHAVPSRPSPDEDRSRGNQPPLIVE